MVIHEDTRAPGTESPTNPDGRPRDAGSELSIWARLKSPKTIASFAIAIALIAFVFRNLNLDLVAILENMASGNPALIGLAFIAYYLGFPARALRWRQLLANAGIRGEAGVPVPSVAGLSRIYILGWFANCIVPAKLGDAYRGYLLKRAAGTSLARTIGTIFAERLIDVLALAGFMALAVLLVFGSNIPSSVQLPLVGGVILAVIGAAGLGGLARYRHAVQGRVPERARPHYERLQDGVLASFARSGSGLLISTSIVIWLLEGARLFLVALAFGVGIGPTEALFVALLASLLTVVPITPSGLGIVESGAIIALTVLGVDRNDAATVALVDRGIAYWSILLVGAVIYLVTRNR